MMIFSTLEMRKMHDDRICATTMQRQGSRIRKAEKAKRRDRIPAGILAILEMR